MVKPGAVVTRIQTSKGEVLIRYPQPGDAPAMLEYINALSLEQTFILMQGEQKTLEEEEEWLQSVLEGMANGSQLYLVVATGERIVGIAGIGLESRVESHIGELGISVAADFRSEGVGTRLFQLINRLADQHLIGLRTVVLGVFGNNHRGHHIYQKYGFREYGRLPGGIFHRGEYVDHILMYREVAPR